MEDNKTKECIAYDGKMTAVGFLKKKRNWLILKCVAAAVAAVLCLAFIGLLFQNDGVSGFFASLALGGMPNGSINGGHVAETEGNDTCEAEGKYHETQITENQPSERDSIEAETEEEKEPPIEDAADRMPTVSDRSFAEKGDGYIINYSGMGVDSEGMLEMGFQNAKYSYSERPVVLILHTHTSEVYYDYDKTNRLHPLTHGVVAIGEKIAVELNSRGISTVHCTVIHDGNGSPYPNARETIETMLKIYPTVEYVIDIHRAEIFDESGAPVKLMSPSGAAQMRITVSSEGQRSRDNLALALCLRRELNQNGQRLCMPVVFTNSSYNARFSPYYLKLDVGSVGNNADEAHKAAEIFAIALTEILKK